MPWPKHLLSFAGFGLKFQGAEHPLHSFGQVDGVPLKSPLGADGPALRAALRLDVRGHVLGVPARRPQDPVGVQAVLPGAGGHWKGKAGPGGGLATGRGRRPGGAIPSGSPQVPRTDRARSGRPGSAAGGTGPREITCTAQTKT